MSKLPASQTPQHVAIILDGNRRWALRRGLPAYAGHYRGHYQTLWPIVEEAGQQGVRYLTLFAFSRENWTRQKTEVDYLLRLFERSIKRRISEIAEAGIRLRTIGEIERFPAKIQKMLADAIALTAPNTGLTLTIALSYGGRQEMVRAASLLTGQPASAVTEASFAANLYDAELPDVDLLIRTSGEKRLSGFLLWQIAYAELYFTETLWPDFSRAEFVLALKDFALRQRRYGS